MRNVAITLLTCTAVSTIFAAQPARLNRVTADLLPRPQELFSESRPDTSFTFTADQLFYRFRGPSDERLAILMEQLKESLQDLGMAVPDGQHVETLKTDPDSGWSLQVGSARDLPHLPLWTLKYHPAESYELQVTERGASIIAAEDRGLFYGVQTLGQLIRAARTRGENTLPGLNIRDWPAIPMRGFSEDYGRNRLPTLEDHKRSIRFLASLKMNTYLWFIEPDHFVYKFDPTIGQAYDRFAFDEIRELVAYAHRYHVEIIPTVELLGHMEMLLAHPSYRKLAELEGGSDLCATCDDSFELIKKLVGEIAPAFDSNYFHCGLDESFVIGKGRSADAVKQRGLEAVMADYYVRMNDLIKSHGKTMMMYADIVLAHPGIIEKLPKTIVMMFWDYIPRDRYEGFDTLHRAGFPMTALSGLWDWVHFYPPYSFAFRNIDSLAMQSRELGAKGYFVSDWGDPIGGAAGMNLPAWAHYGVAYTAAVAWRPQPIPLPQFSEAFVLQHYGSASSELAQALNILAQCQSDRIAKVCGFAFGDPAANLKAMTAADDAELAFWKKLKEAAEEAIPLLAAAKPAMNADQFATVQLAADLLGFTAQMALQFREPSPDGIKALAEQQHQLWQKYKADYLRTNRPLNVQYLQAAWDRVHQGLLKLADSL